MTWLYMPVLKWKRGERDALRFLVDGQWHGITPMLELQPIGVAPDTPTLRGALPAYVSEIETQVKKCIPVEQAVCIDTGYASSDYAKQISLLLAICGALARALEHQIVPVIRSAWLESLAALTPAQVSLLAEYNEVVLRLRTDEVGASQVQSSVDMLARVVKKRRIHLVIDQFSLLDRQATACVSAVKPYLDAALGAGCASITLAGGSFPLNLTGKKLGFTDLPRVEWLIWLEIQKVPAYKALRYADYTVTNPAPLPEDADLKSVNPSIAIRYAADDFWRLYKGRQFKGAPRGELRNLCKLLTSDTVYTNPFFSYGDAKYHKDANGSDKNGLPWTWRRDATNHHMILTAHALLI
ncbi:hypothetical protein AB3X91_09195 [Paraburkholderia sp. BR14263]|uniref:beta family protein n=1 Tax=unclassified Paraburkholderia TaxID=2615204 RepID=UPI0034CF8B0F